MINQNDKNYILRMLDQIETDLKYYDVGHVHMRQTILRNLDNIRNILKNSKSTITIEPE